MQTISEIEADVSTILEAVLGEAEDEVSRTTAAAAGRLIGTLLADIHRIANAVGQLAGPPHSTTEF